MSRVYNFSAGPAVLPESVLQEAAAEMMDYKGTGMSVMEMSHRSKAYQAIIDEAEADLRDLLNIPENYKVLFMQGGASQQFAMIPMNLMKNGVADYIITGQWAKKAYQEAQMYGKANAVASSADKLRQNVDGACRLNSKDKFALTLYKYRCSCRSAYLKGRYLTQRKRSLVFYTVLIKIRQKCFYIKTHIIFPLRIYIFIF